MLSVEETGSSKCTINHCFYCWIWISRGEDGNRLVFNGLRQLTT